MKKQNLWGDLGSLETVRTPSMILREQADLLGELTNEILYGEVGRIPIGGEFHISLNLVAPALQRYRFEILRMEHTLNMYPVKVRDLLNDVVYEASNESEFVDILGNILSSTKVQQAIAALISESTAEIGHVEV